MSHDARYKKLFSNHTIVTELLQYFVNEEFIKDLDFKTLERLDKSFVTDEFKEKESDIIYKINFKDHSIFIFLLIEFQSTVDKSMSLRFLRYICEFYQTLWSNHKFTLLPNVLPILLYNGEAKWTAETNIKDLIATDIPDKYIPNFSYYKICENEFLKTDLLEIKNAMSAIFYAELLTAGEIKENINNILSLLEKENSEILKLFSLWINNMFGKISEELIENINSITEVKQMLSTTIDKWGSEIKLEAELEGVRKGKREGELEGVKKRNVEIARSMKQDGFSTEQIIKYSGLSYEEIEKL